MGDSSGTLWSRRTRTRQPWWSSLPDEDLLQMRVKDLGVAVEGTWLNGCVKALNGELKRKGLIQAHAWLSDEWFSPDTTPGIAIPFYLSHPRLARLEKKMFLDVEGDTRRECMQILRHEAGHIIQHAYALNRRRKWQEMFGRSSTRYPAYYRPNPASKDYVQHLPRWYAQSHPDEDFAETFAVWLTPRSNWRRHYEDWPALEKLYYVDELMAEIAEDEPTLTRRAEVDPVHRLTKTLAEHYEKKLDLYSPNIDTRYDPNLQRIFSDEPRHRNSESASAFLRRNRAAIRQAAWRWSGGYQVTLDAILDQMIDRCRALKLRAPGRDPELRQKVVRLLTTKVAHSLYRASRRQWFAL
jgi:predicted DNA-binding protein YlxM (UPF0122 family)